MTIYEAVGARLARVCTVYTQKREGSGREGGRKRGDDMILTVCRSSA